MITNKESTMMHYILEQGLIERIMQLTTQKHNLKLTIIDRIDGNGVPYRELPNIFQKYEYYLDFKGLTNKEVISKLQWKL